MKLVESSGSDGGWDFFNSAWPLCQTWPSMGHLDTCDTWSTLKVFLLLMLPNGYLPTTYTFTFIILLSVFLKCNHLICCDSKNLFSWVTAVEVFKVLCVQFLNEGPLFCLGRQEVLVLALKVTGFLCGSMTGVRGFSRTIATQIQLIWMLERDGKA